MSQAQTIVLPLPRLPGAHGARRALPDANARESLSLEQISTVLWAGTAFRQQRHGRAALPARLRPLVALYAVLPQGTYRYEPVEHSLVLVTPRDLRRRIAPASGMHSVLDLLYVDCCTPEEEEEWEECGILAGAGPAHMAQNVAAHCASIGLLASVAPRISPQLAAALDLPPPHRIALVQRIGYPAAGPH
ncbi:MAG TPA: hypothetical protein VGD76_03480 [Ramlibacter sp.]